MANALETVKQYREAGADQIVFVASSGTLATLSDTLENLSDADVIAHGREARPRRRPIWTNPFLRDRAALWRKGWHRPQDPVESFDAQADVLFLKAGTSRIP